jgi:hypothetical protein
MKSIRVDNYIVCLATLSTADNIGAMETPASQSLDEVLKTTTAPDVSFKLCGFADEEVAKMLAHTTLLWVKVVGTKLNLAALDGITIAFDYPKALQELDRGYVSSKINAPTTELAQGIAMAPVVIRDGAIKTHLVLDANVFTQLLDKEGENWPMVFYQLAHECGHVHDHSVFDAAFPNVLLKPPHYKTLLEEYQVLMAYGCCAEYSASRLSAGYWPEQASYFETTFFNVLEGLEERTKLIIDEFKNDNDGLKLFNRLSEEYERMLKFTSYLLGHINGLGGAVEPVPKFKEFMESGHWLAEYITELDKSFDKYWEKYGAWTNFEEFCEIGVIVQLLVGLHGAKPHLEDDGRMSIAVW